MEKRIFRLVINIGTRRIVDEAVKEFMMTSTKILYNGKEFDFSDKNLFSMQYYRESKIGNYEDKCYINFQLVG